MEENEKDPQGGEREEDTAIAEEESEGAEAGKAEEPKEADEVDFEKVEPETRKRPIDYIEERRARRAEREPGSDGRREDIENEEEVLTPAAQRLVDRRVREALERPLKAVAQNMNEREIDETVARHPEWAKYKPLARKYMNQTGWDGVPAERIFKMIDYDYAAKRGAEAERETARQARRVPSGGSSSRPAERRGGNKITAEDIAKLDQKQFQALQSRLAQGESIAT